MRGREGGRRVRERRGRGGLGDGGRDTKSGREGDIEKDGKIDRQRELREVAGTGRRGSTVTRSTVTRSTVTRSTVTRNAPQVSPLRARRRSFTARPPAVERS